jgi:hypothetical protein
MKKYSRNYYASSGEWIPHRAKMEWQCCDCGLVHNVWFRIGEFGNLEVKMTLNNKLTKLVRNKNENPSQT